MADQRILDRISFLFFAGSASSLLLCAGVFLGANKIFPYRQLNAAYQFVFHQSGTPHFLRPSHYDFSGVRQHNPAAIEPGVTLISTYWKSFGWKPGIKIIDADGSVLHEWRINPSEIIPHKNPTTEIRNTLDTYVHGCYLFDNGDIIFNIEYVGLVRMNAAGEVVWTFSSCRTHHSVFRDARGHFWVCGVATVEDTPEGRERLKRYPGPQLPLSEDFILQIDENGKLLRKISILELLYKSRYRYLLWQMRFHDPTGDILHTNDIEVLSPQMADQYPLFNAGDILVSCRELNSVFVIDHATEEITWLYNKSLHRQHDPDFTGGGNIRVFNNNWDGSDNGTYLGGTTLLDINPSENTDTVVYPRSENSDFYSYIGGKAQSLSNGNILITEAMRGRVFEVDSTGATVWEWVNDCTDGTLIPEVLEGTRYRLSPEEISRWSN